MARKRPAPSSDPSAPAGRSARTELVAAVAASRICAELSRRLASPDAPIEVCGLWGPAGALLLAALADGGRRSVLAVCPGAEEAERLEEDLAGFCPSEVRGFPAWDVLPGEADQPEPDCLSARLGALEALRRAGAGDGTESAAVIAPAAALLQPVPRPEALARSQLELRGGMRMDRGALLAWLAGHGYERGVTVCAPGEFAVRGGIVDIWPLFSQAGCRLEFADDRVESLRSFDAESQRSADRLPSLRLAGLDRAAAFRSSGGDLFDHLPPQSLVAVFEPEDIAAHAELYAAGFAPRPGRAAPDPAALTARLEGWPGRLVLRRVGAGRPGELDFGAQSLERLTSPDAGHAVAALLELASIRRRVWVFSGNRAESGRLAELVAAQPGGCTAPPRLDVAQLSGSFDWPAESLAVVTERQLLGRYRQRRAVRPHTVPAGIPIESLTDLSPGDYVVHRTHGIGRYLGIEALEKAGRTEEHLVLLYADDARLYVPAGTVELVARYLAPGGGQPELSRLGSRRWAEKKRRAGEAVRDIAAEMLRLAAARSAQPGVTCPPGGEWERAFVESFPYDDTADQAAAWEAVRADLESPRPADRLLCGDVGFGKTEIAVRAAFKVAAAGHQVAVLVPTTLLAEQHGRTFRERMADYPVRVEVLSRFRTAGEQRAILDDLAAGTVDVVIGTHRLVQKDVAFRDLGLVIVDEEQRFGVVHKERLKHLRASVNVLTLTATPIPRTLHMAMLGLRDISSLETPPADRLAVRTLAARWSDDLIRRAVLRELARDGQVYFVHNRVESIARLAGRLEKLLPEARLAVAHGQMSEHELDRAMTSFLDRRADILLSTVIIESGLDIPSVNTIFIDRADRFGLADLHQLRGRVGRRRHRAWCYLLIPPEEAISHEALARVKALEEFSDLGAGFRLAMRDLELRGAGNLLGSEQSGHIEEVGYDMYARLLERSGHELRGEPVPEEWECSVNLAGKALLPEPYMPAAGERLEVYRRLAASASDAEVGELAADLADRYGRLPEEALGLFAEARIRIRARAARAALVARDETGRLLVRLYRRRAREAAARLGRGLDVRFPDDETLTVGLPPGAAGEAGKLLAWAEQVLSRMRCAGAATEMEMPRAGFTRQ